MLLGLDTPAEDLGSSEGAASATAVAVPEGAVLFQAAGLSLMLSAGSGPQGLTLHRAHINLGGVKA